MLSGEGNENGEKTTIGLISKKATLHVQHTFFVHFFAVVLHDYNVKLPETSWLLVLYMEEMSYVFLFIFFTLPLIFILVAASILSLPPPLQNFNVVLPTKKMFPLSFIARSISSCMSLILI